MIGRVDSRWLLALIAVGGLLLSLDTPPGWSDEPQPPPSSLIWKVSGDVPAMMAACKNMPALYSFSRNGYLSIECGYQAILLGSKVPLAPAPHVPWARPYAKGPLKVLTFTMFGNAPADTIQLAQLARELDCEMRFVLIADVPAHSDWGHDEAYRTGYLAEQARTALKEDCDVVLMALGSYSPSFGYAPARNAFPDDVYRTILEKTRRGTGLVLVGSNMGGWWVEKTPLVETAPAKMTGARRVPQPQAKPGPDLDLLAGTALADLPLKPEKAPAYTAMAVYDWELKPGAKVAATESGKPLVICGVYGEGRTVLLGWDGTLTPTRSSGPRLQFEHGLATTLRAVAYAAKKEPPVAVVPKAAELAAGAAGKATVTTSGLAQLHWTVRDADFEILAAGESPARPGENAIPLPPLPTGKYWLDVIARDDKGASLGWGSGPLAATGEATLTLATNKDVYKIGETVTVTGELRNVPPGRSVEVQIRDAAGRVLAAGPAQGQDKSTFSYRILDTRVAPHYALVTVSQGKAPLLRGRVEFFVPSHAWTDYENILWPGGTSELTPAAREVCGLTAVMDSWGGGEMGRAGAENGLRAARMNDGPINPAAMQTAPEKGATEHEQVLVSAIEAARKYGAVCWAFQDERHCMEDAGMPNAEGLRRYRAYLQQQYRSLAALNASWGSRYKDWNEVMPLLTKELQPATKNLAPWVDFRLYVADQVYQADARHAKMVRDVLGPGAYVGVDGFTSSGHMVPYGGMDMGRYLAEGTFNFYCPYGDDLLIASMVRGPMVKYIGWGMSRNQYIGYPWRDAFRGQWGTFRFFGPTFFSQFGWVNPAGAWIGEGTRELREGVGKALMGARRELSPVAILYSYPSMMTCAGAGVWVEKGNAHLMWQPANSSRDAFERELLQCGVSFGYVSDVQAAQGALRGKRLLVIPQFMGMALSDATCAAIKEFVAQGGVVVADMCPGICDEHGRPREKGACDDLFGVTRNGFAYEQRYPDYLVGITKPGPLVPKDGWWIGQWYEKDLKVTDGTALGKHWFVDVPALITKKTGQGQSLLLNFLQTATVKRNGEPEDDELKLMQRLLTAARIRPPAEINDAAGASVLKNYEVNVLRDGGVQYVGAYCNTTPEDAENVVIEFPEARETYDLRAGKHLGRVKQARLPLRAYGAALFARLDYQVSDLSAKAEYDARGSAVPVLIDLACTGKSTPERHVVRLQVLSPDGKRNDFYTQNVDVWNGHWRGVIATALNDPRGTWTIQAREIMSGKTATATFQLR